MTTPEGIGPDHPLETDGLRPESSGGAGMTQEGAPIGFTAEVGGAAPGVSDDPDELGEDLPAASAHGPVSDGERRERGEDIDDIHRAD